MPPSTIQPVRPHPDGTSSDSSPADGSGDASGASDAGAAASDPLALGGGASLLDGSGLASLPGDDGVPGAGVDPGGAGAGVGPGVTPGGSGVGAGVDVGRGVAPGGSGVEDGSGSGSAAGVLVGSGVCPPGVGVGVGAVVTVTTRSSLGAGCGFGPSLVALNTSCQDPAGSIVVVDHVPFANDPPGTSDMGSGSPPSPTICTVTEVALRSGLLLEYSIDRTKLVSVVPVGGEALGFESCEAAMAGGGATSNSGPTSASPATRGRRRDRSGSLDTLGGTGKRSLG